MESKVKDGNYVTIQSWMVKELNLKGNELLVYAIIYMFSQDGEGKFNGSLQYLADWTNSSKRSVLNNIQSLLKKDLIIKEEQIFQGVKKVQYYGKKFNGVVKKVQWGGEKSSLNNKEDNKEDIKEKEINKESWEYFDSPKLDKAFKDYVEMRKTIKKPMTLSAKEIAMKKLHTLANGDEEKMIAILEQSVMNSWQGLFELKDVPAKDKDFLRRKYGQE